MKFYDCHKRVQAAKIAQIAPHSNDAGADILFEVAGDVEVPTAIVSVDGEFMARHKPEGGGYYVVYQDGYTSFSPAEAFESGYSPASEDEAGSDEVSPALVKANQQIAELEAALESAVKFIPVPAEGASVARIPAHEVVRIGAVPFRLLADAVVEGTQGHVNEALEDLHAYNEAPQTGNGEGSTDGPRQGDALQKFLGARVGHPLTLKVLPIQPGEPDHASVRIASVDQASAIEGMVVGNVFFPKG